MGQVALLHSFIVCVFFILIFHFYKVTLAIFLQKPGHCLFVVVFIFLTKIGFIRSKTRHYFYVSVKPILGHGSHITSPDLQWG